MCKIAQQQFRKNYSYNGAVGTTSFPECILNNALVAKSLIRTYLRLSFKIANNGHPIHFKSFVF